MPKKVSDPLPPQHGQKGKKRDIYKKGRVAYQQKDCILFQYGNRQDEDSKTWSKICARRQRQRQTQSRQKDHQAIYSLDPSIASYEFSSRTDPFFTNF